MTETWVDITTLGSAYEVQLDVSSGSGRLRYRPRVFMRRCFDQGVFREEEEQEAEWQYGPPPDQLLQTLKDRVTPAKHCNTCRFWGNNRGFGVDDAEERLKSCSCPKFKYGYGCYNVPDDGAVVEDDVGWGIQTGPLFGCVNWEGK